MVAVGGLHIIGTERHESRRIDNQLRGRAGRKGIRVLLGSMWPWRTILCGCLAASAYKG